MFAILLEIKKMIYETKNQGLNQALVFFFTYSLLKTQEEKDGVVNCREKLLVIKKK